MCWILEASFAMFSVLYSFHQRKDDWTNSICNHKVQLKSTRSSKALGVANGHAIVKVLGSSPTYDCENTSAVAMILHSKIELQRYGLSHVFQKTSSKLSQVLLRRSANQ